MAAAAAMAATRSFLEKLHSSHALTPPAAVELRDLGVWAKERVVAGTRYGPFLGKWALEPANPAYAWEVSEISDSNQCTGWPIWSRTWVRLTWIWEFHHLAQLPSHFCQTPISPGRIRQTVE